MTLTQIIFTLAAKDPHTPEQCEHFSNLSVSVCKALSISGRVFATDIEALFILEGEPEQIKKYYNAVRNDPKTAVAITHSEQIVNAREFSDFSVWNSYHSKGSSNSNVYDLNAHTADLSLPDNISVKSRLLTKALMPSVQAAS